MGLGLGGFGDEELKALVFVIYFDLEDGPISGTNQQDSLHIHLLSPLATPILPLPLPRPIPKTLIDINTLRRNGKLANLPHPHPLPKIQNLPNINRRNLIKLRIPKPNHIIFSRTNNNGLVSEKLAQLETIYRFFMSLFFTGYVLSAYEEREIAI